MSDLLDRAARAICGCDKAGACAGKDGKPCEFGYEAARAALDALIAAELTEKWRSIIGAALV